MDLLALPYELLVAIVAYLHPKDILSFCLVNHFAQDVYTRSFNLQYLVALFTTEKEDARLTNPMSLRDRLAYILQREAMWTALDLDKDRLVEIPIKHRHSHIHDLAAGLYIFGELNLAPDNLKTDSLRYAHLPTCMHPGALAKGPGYGEDWWTTIPIGAEALCIGLSLEENDLLAVLTSVPITDTDGLHAFELRLRRFSTTNFHHLAREPVIQFHQHRNVETHCIAAIEIAGPYLLIVLSWLRAPNISDELYVYDWTMGLLLLHISPGNSTYRGAAFLDQETFILTNMREQSIELFELSPSITDLGITRCNCIGKLGLPTLREGCSLASISCRTDSVRAPVANAVVVPATGADDEMLPPLFKLRKPPVRCLPEKALVQFRTYVQAGHGGDEVALFTFVSHREDLFDAISLGHIPSEDDERDVIPWQDWGPSRTRWNDANETDTAWMAAVAGQRQVYISRDGPRHIRVRNFNRLAVRRMLKASAARAFDQGRCRVVVGESIAAHQGYFLDDIRSSLPFVEVSSAGTFDYDGVLMDEEHIIGLKENEEDGSIQELAVYIMTPEDPRSCDCQQEGAG